MIIRKLFKAKSTHLVRNCYSARCSKSIHSHSAVIEVFLKADTLDNAQMVMDFGILKNEIRDFINSFNDSYLYWDKEDVKFKKYINTFERTIKLPTSPSAESLSLTMLYVIDKIMSNTQLNNNEGKIHVHSVRYHETDTGYAEAFQSDLSIFPYTLKDIVFNDEIMKNWNNKDLWNNLINKEKFIYTNPFQQIIY